MTHYTTNGTAFLSTTTPFHSCATELTFPVFRCASHPQLCNVDTVMSTEVGLIESRTNRASTGMQTPTGRLQPTCDNMEATNAAWLASRPTTGASPPATGGCILPRDAYTGHSHVNRVPRPADKEAAMFTHGGAPAMPDYMHTPMNFWAHYRECGHASRSQDIHPQPQHSAGQRSPSLELGPIDPRFHRPFATGQPQPFASVHAPFARTPLAERDGAHVGWQARGAQGGLPVPSKPGVERVPAQARFRRTGMLL